MSNCLDYSEDHSSAHHPPKSSPQVGSTQSEPDYQIENHLRKRTNKRVKIAILAIFEKWTVEKREPYRSAMRCSRLKSRVHKFIKGQKACLPATISNTLSVKKKVVCLGHLGYK